MFLINLGSITVESAHGGARTKRVPASFAADQWRLSDAGAGGALAVDVLALPADGGAAIDTLERRVDGGAWTTLGAAVPGAYRITGLRDGVSAAVELRAVNGVGAGAASDVKQAVPGAAPAAPLFLAPLSIAPASGPVGTVFALSEGVATGSPAPTLTGVLTLDGTDVTPPGLSYTSTAPGALVWTVTAANGVTPNATSQAGATVVPVAGVGAFTDNQWALDDAATDGGTLYLSLMRPPAATDMAGIAAIERQFSTNGGTTWGAATVQPTKDIRYNRRADRLGIYALPGLSGATSVRVRLLRGAETGPWSLAKTATPTLRATASTPSMLPAHYWHVRDVHDNAAGDSLRVTFRGWSPDLGGFAVNWTSTGGAWNDIDFEMETGTVGGGGAITWSGAPFRLDHANAGVESSNDSFGRAAINLRGLAKGQQYAVRARTVTNRLTTPVFGPWSAPKLATPTSINDRPALALAAYLEGQRADAGAAVSIAAGALFTGATSFAKSEAGVAGYGADWPASLTLDPATGLIGGTVPAAGVYWLGVRARNASGVRDAAVELVVAAAGAFSVANQTIIPGAKAVAGAGAIRLTSIAGQITGLSSLTGARAAEWQIVNGDRLAPSGAVVTAGTFGVTVTNGTISTPIAVTVAPVANAIRVLPRKAEIEAAWAAAAPGDTISVAPGAQLDGRITLAAKTGPVTITSEGFLANADPRLSTRPATLAGGVSIEAGVSGLTLRGLRIVRHYHDEWVASGSAELGLVHFIDNTITDFTAEQIEFASQPILEIVEGNWLQRLLAFNRTNIAVEPVNMVVTDCHVHDLGAGMPTGFDAQGLTWSRNMLHSAYGSVGLNGEFPVRMFDNLSWGFWGGAEDVDPLSTPIHSGLGGSSGNANLVPVQDIKLIGNVVKSGADRYLHDGQESSFTGVKFNDPIIPGAYRNIEIAYNLIMVSSGFALEVSGGDGVLIHHNTLMPEPEMADQGTPSIVSSNDDAWVKGTDFNRRFKIFANIVEGGVSPSPSWTRAIGDNRPGDDLLMWDNIITGRDVTAPFADGSGQSRRYRDYFNGHPTQPWGSLDGLQAAQAFVPKPWTRASAANLGALGTAFYARGDNGAHTTPDTLTGSPYAALAGVPDDRHAPPFGGAGASAGFPLTTWPAGATITTGSSAETGAALSGLADGTTGTIAAIVRFASQVDGGRDTDDLGQTAATPVWIDHIISTSPVSVVFTRDTYGKLELTLWRPDGSMLTTLETWYRPASFHGPVHVVVSWDTGADRYAIAINGKSIGWRESDLGAGKVGNGVVGYTRSTNWKIGNGTFRGDMGFVGFRTGFTDLETAAGLGVLFGADGKLKDPGGTWLVEYRGDAATLNGAGGVNLGTAPQKFIRVSGPAITDFVPDTTAPVLSGATLSSVQQASAQLSVSTDEVGGNIFWAVSTVAAPSVADVIAGTGAISSSFAFVGSIAAPFLLDADGLSGATGYFFHAVHEDAAGNRSARVSVAFTTSDAVPVVRMPGTAWVWLPDTLAALNNNVDAQTIAFAVRDPLVVNGGTEIYFAANGFSTFIRMAGTTLAISIKQSGVTGSAYVFTGLPSFSADARKALILSFDRTSAALWVDGVTFAPTTNTPDPVAQFLGFKSLNAVNITGTSRQQFDIDGFYWLDNARRDPAVLAPLLFDAGFNPRALPVDGAVGGITPTLYLAGDAAAWQARARGTKTAVVSA